MHLIVLDAPAGEEGAARQAEVRAATQVLGVADLSWWPSGEWSLPEDHTLAARVSAAAANARTVYAPAPIGGAAQGARVPSALAAGLAARAGVEAVRVVWFDDPAGGLLDLAQALTEKTQALERLDVEEVPEETLRAVDGREALLDLNAAFPSGAGRATAVLSTWNKSKDVLANLEGLVAQTCPFDRIVVVDNASSDDTMERVRRHHPQVELVVMPHSAYGACETFNIGFACADTELIAILDDDVVLPPAWLERALARLDDEPDTTAIVSTKIVEPGMPEAYRSSPSINTERYMSTFRGCASLARKAAIQSCGYYDERLFIYGNERDLTMRLLNRGFRVLQFPGTHAFHKTPFGIQMGKRSLYYHARNAWLVQLKYAPLGELLKLPFLVVGKVLLRSEAKEASGEIAGATGTIGIGSSIKKTKGAWWVLVRAAWSVLLNVPYCMKHREPCTAQDYELPIE